MDSFINKHKAERYLRSFFQPRCVNMAAPKLQYWWASDLNDDYMEFVMRHTVAYNL